MNTSSWPSPATFNTPSAARRYKETKAAKKKELAADVYFLKSKQVSQLHQKIERLKPKRDAIDDELDGAMSSTWFKDWLSDVGYSDPENFKTNFLSGLNVNTRASRMGFRVASKSEQFTSAISNLLHSDRWKSRSYRNKWAREVSACPDPFLRRKVMLKLATPKWANAWKMAGFYRLRDEMARSTGVPHNVDHIIPLQGVLVCGLNCEHNFQVIPAADNMRKSNKFNIE